MRATWLMSGDRMAYGMAVGRWMQARGAPSVHGEDCAGSQAGAAEVQGHGEPTSSTLIAGAAERSLTCPLHLLGLAQVDNLSSALEATEIRLRDTIRHERTLRAEVSLAA